MRFLILMSHLITYNGLNYMGRKIRISKGKTMKPNFFVFCEGETEVAYVKFLRSIYRIPIQIIPRKSDSNISNKYIENCKKEYITTKNDRTFLMFDLDVDGMYEHLQKIKDAVLLVSNPCVELWFLLHCEDCKNELDSDTCVRRLKSKLQRYSKGVLLQEEKLFLTTNVAYAVERASLLEDYKNPSTTIYRLIQELTEISKY